jgi:hypothetical protein
VTSISLANLQGPASIPPYINSPVRREYEFRVYQQLGELYIKQERVKDAADTFGAFAQRSPSHPEAPVLQARVIDIYAAAGFSTLALDAKKQYVTHYGVGSEYQQQPGRLDAQRRAAGEDSSGRAGALSPRRRAEDEEDSRITRKRCAGTAAT